MGFGEIVSVVAGWWLQWRGQVAQHEIELKRMRLSMKDRFEWEQRQKTQPAQKTKWYDPSRHSIVTNHKCEASGIKVRIEEFL